MKINMSELEELRELRKLGELVLNGYKIKTIQDSTIALGNLKVAFSGLNSEMKAFNENVTKSNKFLSQIAKLQKSMDAQAKAATIFTWAVIGLAILQVILTSIQILLR